MTRTWQLAPGMAVLVTEGGGASDQVYRAVRRDEAHEVTIDRTSYEPSRRDWLDVMFTDGTWATAPTHSEWLAPH